MGIHGGFYADSREVEYCVGILSTKMDEKTLVTKEPTATNNEIEKTKRLTEKVMKLEQELASERAGKENYLAQCWQWSKLNHELDQKMKNLQEKYSFLEKFSFHNFVECRQHRSTIQKLKDQLSNIPACYLGKGDAP